MGLSSLGRQARAKDSNGLRLALSLHSLEFPDLTDFFSTLDEAKIVPTGRLESSSAQPWHYSAPMCLEFLKPDLPSYLLTRDAA